MKRSTRSVMFLAVAGCMLAGMLLPQLAKAEVKGAIRRKSNGQVVSGAISWDPRNQVYMVRTTRVQMQVPRTDVEAISVPEPPALKAAANQVRSKMYAAAIPGLEALMKDYRMLKWDQDAAAYLAKAHMGMNEPMKAIRTCESIIKENPEAAVHGGMAGTYWDALIAAKQGSTLKRVLKQAIATGDRRLAAIAQVKRGDLEMQDGRTKEALLDGYLRTVVLFQEVKEAQPEALLKAMQCFEQLGQHSYAEKMRKRLLGGYADSPQAQQIRAGS